MADDDKPKKRRGNPAWIKKAPPQAWKPGQSGNPGGRPKYPEIQQLRDALEKAKGLKGDQSFLEAIAIKAYDDTALAIAILRKLLPDMTKAEIETLGEIKVTLMDYKNAQKDK